MRVVSKNISKLLAVSLLGISCLPASAVVRLGDLGPLEVKFFSHQYERETPAERLDRLERLVFGSVQSGSIEERVARLSKTIDTAMPEKTQIDNSTALKPDRQDRQPASMPSKAPQISDGSGSDYPRVSELERSLLGRTYATEPVRQRLSRLETKAYGAPSRVDDLATRVDSLSSYAGVYGMQPGDSTSINSPSLAGSAGLDTQSQRRSPGILEKVSTMESKVFGRPSSGQALGQRIAELERKVFGSVASSPAEDMTTRVGQLWAKTQVGEGQTARAPQTAQTMQPFSGQGFRGQSPAYSQANSAAPFAGTRFSNGSYISNSSANSSGLAASSAYDPYNSQAPFAANTYNQSSSNGAYNSAPFMASNGMSTNQFGKTKNKYKNKSQQHGSLLGKIGKVVAFAGSAAVGAGGLAVGAIGSMNTGYYGMSMGSGFGSPYSYSGFAPGYSTSSYGSVSTIGSFGSMSSAYGAPFASSYASSFFSP
jgi:hypothetical protein